MDYSKLLPERRGEANPVKQLIVFDIYNLMVMFYSIATEKAVVIERNLKLQK
jgi:hypothetical protein